MSIFKWSLFGGKCEFSGWLPSRELTYPTLGEGKSSTQNCLGKGYVSYQVVNSLLIGPAISWGGYVGGVGTLRELEILLVEKILQH